MTMMLVMLVALLPVLVPSQARAQVVDSDPTIQVLQSIPQAQEYWQSCYAKCHANHECSAVMCANRCKGDVIRKAETISRIGQIMDFNVKAAYAASCIDKFSDYLKKIRDAAKNAQNLGLDISTLIVKTIVDQILDAILSQIFNSLTNSICNVTNEAMGAIDSFMRNAICLPTASLGNPLDFNLDLGRMQCNGWSINALTGDINGQIIEGVPNPSNSSLSTGTTYTSTPIVDTVITPATPTTADPVTVPVTDGTVRER